MKTWILSGILVLCLAVGFMAACNENRSGAEPDKANPNQVASNETRTDTGITAEVKAKITDDELLDNTDVSTETENGVVTLTGTVKTEAQKTRAEEIARNTKGVVSVNSKVVVDPNYSSLTDKTKEAAKEVEQKTKEVAKDAEQKTKEGYSETKEALGDARITSEVKLKFAADDTVKALNIDVDTDNGTVTLNGTVNSKKELDQAIRLAKSVEGVKHVKSNLQISQQ